MYISQGINSSCYYRIRCFSNRNRLKGGAGSLLTYGTIRALASVVLVIKDTIESYSINALNLSKDIENLIELKQLYQMEDLDVEAARAKGE